MKKLKNFNYYNSIINKIQNTRKKNNKNWMDLMRIAFKYQPNQAKIVVKKIFSDDKKINKLIQKLVR
tara:strand:+ start:4 stop:204 length:201 start_codon:yes stop_codon:yes gene_type:complete